MMSVWLVSEDRLEKRTDTNFWKSFLSPLKGTVYDRSSLVGASGLAHPILGLSVDEDRKRAVIVSPEPDARGASLICNDVGQRHSDYNFIVARPVLFEPELIIANAISRISKREFTLSELNEWAERAAKQKSEKVASEVIDFFKTAVWPSFGVCYANPILAAAHLASLLRNISCLDFGEDPNTIAAATNQTDIQLSVDRILKSLKNQADATLGICQIPLYEFTDDETKLFQERLDPEAVETCLRKWGIYQYFFPPKDQLALGLAHRGVGDIARIVDYASLSSKIGHPLDKPELVKRDGSIFDIITQLKEQGLAVSVKHEVHVTEAGTQARTKLTGQPRESFITKLLQRVTINISTDKWFRIGADNDAA